MRARLPAVYLSGLDGIFSKSLNFKALWGFYAATLVIYVLTAVNLK